MPAFPPTDYRPWPIPDWPWWMFQEWTSMLFVHWPVPAESLARFLPTDVVLDTYDGQGWVSVVAFQTEAARIRGVPISVSYPQVNVRTYVGGQKPGVYFFSVDVANRLAARFARRVFALPCQHARITLDKHGRNFHVATLRGHTAFEATYHPDKTVFVAQADSLDAWLMERYCYYVKDARQRLYRAEIHHKRWPLQTTQVSVRENSLANMYVSGEPARAHFVKRIDVFGWGRKRLIQ